MATMKNKKNERDLLYEYLDGFHFVNQTEVYMATSDYFSDNGERQLSYWELSLCNALADRYIADREMRVNEEGDIVEYEDL